MSYIYFENINFSYKSGKKVFENFSLNLEPHKPGFITAIMGASGSGKSTLLKLILGIETIQSGKLILEPNNPIISYVPQEPILFEHMSPEKNARYFQFAGLYKSRFNESLYNELAVELGLKELLNISKSVNEISGGQKQRLSLLRALSINPEIILLDEPCNGLDADVKLSFLSKLREITENYGYYVLYVTHHKLEAQLIADEVVYLEQNDNNQLVLDAKKETILDFIENPPTLEAAKVFKFPDYKVIPISNNDITIISDYDNASHYLLIDDNNIVISDNLGWKFKVISKSPMYCIIKHEFTNLELRVKTDLISNNKIGDVFYFTISGEYLKYNKSGLLEN